MNYHTFITLPHVPSNATSRQMNVLFSTVITSNTDKPILGPDTETRWAGLSLTLTVFGVKEHLKEERVIPKIGWCIGLNHSPHLTGGPCFFPYGGPGGIRTGRHSEGHHQPQILTPLLRMYPRQTGAWVIHHPSLPSAGLVTSLLFTVKHQPTGSG